jgi:hypothetical protein
MSAGSVRSEAASPPAFDARPGLLVVLALLALYGGLALTVDFPRAAIGIQSDEATYYMMGHSLATDGDLTYRREDLQRVWREFPSGPTGLFLKQGRDVLEWGFMLRPPFFWTRTQPDPDQQRFFYGKSFAYPLFAAPFVRVFGTNGFLVLHALLIALSVWCAYLFLHARMGAWLSASLAAAFVLVTIVPVYFVWISPEVFNFAIGLLAYFCWLYKEVAPASRATRWTGWLWRPASDIVAALLIGIATFSKLPYLLILLPMGAWHLWHRRWGRLLAIGAVFLATAGGFFAANIGISGEWNYQGSTQADGRRTFVFEFPFQTPTSGFAIPEPGSMVMGRNESLTEVILDPRVFWTNLRHNLGYFFIGRYGGLVPYLFPAVFAMLAMLSAPRQRPGWQYLVLASTLAQIVFMIVNLPYTWSGGGGSIGNRYFLGVYGTTLFLMPPLTRGWLAVIPWAVGGLFTAQLVMNPFATSFHPGNPAKRGPLRLLPVELTEVNDLPIMTDGSRVRVWFGDAVKGDVADPGFQIYFLDDNAYNREPDKTFWVRGEGRAEFLIKADFPASRLVLSLTAGMVPTTAKASVGGRTHEVVLGAGDSQQVTFNLPPGFWYQARAFVWVVSISSSNGFVPLFHDSSTDTRYLGVRVRPRLVPPAEGH